MNISAVSWDTEDGAIRTTAKRPGRYGTVVKESSPQLREIANIACDSAGKHLSHTFSEPDTSILGGRDVRQAWPSESAVLIAPAMYTIHTPATAQHTERLQMVWGVGVSSGLGAGIDERNM